MAIYFFGISFISAFFLARAVFGQSCCPDGNSIISTFAGTGAFGYSGDGGPATSATFGGRINDVALDAAGNLYICDSGNNVVRKVSLGGTITTIAGNGMGGYSGDGGPATSAKLFWPSYIALDNSGNLYISDYDNSAIRKVSPSGIITTIAGTGTAGYGGDGGPATSALLAHPYGVAVDASGNILIDDLDNRRIRKVSPGGIIATIAGTGNAGHTGDGGPAVLANIDYPEALVLDPFGNIYFTDDSSGSGVWIRMIDGSGIIHTVAGNGACCFSGDGGPATLAAIDDSEGYAFCGGNIYIADRNNNRIRMINPCGIISTVAGNGTYTDSGDGGPASASTLDPVGMALDLSGNLYVADVNSRVRKIAADCSPSPTPACTQSPIPTTINTYTFTPSPTPTNSPTITPTFTVTNTPTLTPTYTPTFTPTSTPSFTPTFTPTFTLTPTPTCVPYVWPDPFNPKYAVGGVLKIGCVTPGSKVGIYTLSGELVRTLSDASFAYGSPFTAVWDGLNQNGIPVSDGIYYYVIQQGDKVLSRGKFLVLHTG